METKKPKPNVFIVLSQVVGEVGLGAQPGLLGALHTWSQTLSANPHVHYIVTFGGLAPDGTWKTPTRDCPLPRQVLMSMFRGKFPDKVRKLVSSDKLVMPEGWTKAKCLSILNQLGRAPWNVKLLERYAHAKGVTLYLARYLRGDMQWFNHFGAVGI